MADKKISQLPAATTPLAGTEVLPIVQSGSTVKVSVSDLTAGRNVSANDLTTTGNTILGNASTDTLNVGNNGLIKDASGNVGIGIAPSAWSSSYRAIDLNNYASFAVEYTNVGQALMCCNAYATGNGSSPTYKRNSTDASSLYLLSNNTHKWYIAPPGTAGGTISFTQVMGIDTSGNVTANTGNLVIGTSGRGIDFSATANSSGTMTSELLSDYEEGTWTPVVGTLTLGNGTVSGKYVKIGKLVTVTASFVWGSTTSGSGTLSFSGLPYTSGASGVSYGSGNALDSGVGNYALLTRVSPNSSSVYIAYYVAGTYAQWTGLQASGLFAFGTNDTVEISISYLVD